jgi:hypothetical protein
MLDYLLMIMTLLYKLIVFYYLNYKHFKKYKLVFTYKMVSRTLPLFVLQRFIYIIGN